MRKPKVLPPKTKTTRRPVKDELQLDTMLRPNLNRSYLFESDPKRPYPMGMLLRYKKDTLVGAFIRACYDNAYMKLWDGTYPPTWMDPQLFIEQCLRDQHVIILRDRLLAKPSRQRLQLLEERLQHVFEEQYLSFLLARFDEAKELFARWLTASELYRRNDPTKKYRKRKR